MIVSKDFLLSKEQARLLTSALQYTVELFRGEEEIWPDQCDFAVSRLEDVKIVVQDYCTLFDIDLCSSVSKTADRPDGGCIVTLHYASKQLGELQMLVAAFQPACRSLSKHIKKKRAEILDKLELFLLNSEDVFKGMTPLEERSSQRKDGPRLSGTCTGISSTEERQSYPRHQPQHVIASRSDHPSHRILPPPYLIPVRDDYTEERDAPKFTQAEEEQTSCMQHAMQPDGKQQKRENAPGKTILPLIKCPMERRRSTANNAGSSS